MKVLVHYNEIGLKGKNRRFFENKLVDNIKNKLNVEDVKRESKRLILDVDNFDGLDKIFGIAYYSVVYEVDSDENKIIKKTINLIKKLRYKEINLKTTRSDKGFKLTSLELNKKIGEEINKLELKVNFSSEEKIFIEITKDRSYIYSEKIEGLKGLPVGSGGKVLCLFSGGIDSCVAAYLAMKRGCKVDFLHFHALKENKDVEKTKIKEIINVLNEYQGNCKLHLIPYHNYQLSVNVSENFDVVVFKNFMLRFAEKLKDYKALIVGDSIGQVASQTLDNLNASRFGILKPILSPLITYDKQEIIDLAKKISTYEDSIVKYKDCCSIIAKKPNTHVKIFEIEKVLEKLNFDELIKDSFKDMDSVKIS